MNIFYLHGGGETKQNSKNKHFRKEVFSNHDKHAKVLIITESNPNSENSFFDKFLNTLSSFSGNLYDYILADKENIQTQIRESDVIIFTGGDYYLTYDYFKTTKIIDILQKTENKTIVAISAGANVLVNQAYSIDYNKFLPGFGYIPINISCHFSKKYIDTYMAVEEFANQKGMIYPISESHYLKLFY